LQHLTASAIGAIQMNMMGGVWQGEYPHLRCAHRIVLERTDILGATPEAAIHDARHVAGRGRAGLQNTRVFYPASASARSDCVSDFARLRAIPISR
jgi:hypothetical protein